MAKTLLARELQLAGPVGPNCSRNGHEHANLDAGRSRAGAALRCAKPVRFKRRSNDRRRLNVVDLTLAVAATLVTLFVLTQLNALLLG